MGYVDELLQAIISGEVTTRDGVLRLKARLCKKHGLAKVPTNYELLAEVPEELRDIVEPLLRNKPVRTISGVAPVAVMTSPSDCPHGRCSYCPGGVPNNSPQSYTGREPAALRAATNEFDPYRQTSSRLEQLKAIGHRTDKVDLIVMGGTFTSRPSEYQEWFVKRCFDAMNGRDSEDIESAHSVNETAASRCVGLTVETRPDWFDARQIDWSMRLGATKVELGVQILDDEVLDGVRRGHHVLEVVEATRRAKDAGLKVCYHVMPGLPGSTREKDLRSFRLMFEDSRFRPDMLKIYPTLVVKGTELYERWVKGEYTPLSEDDGVALVAEMKTLVPPWVRILRIQRDIPAGLIEAGIRKGHLRELVAERMAGDGTACGCIRCREVGHRDVAASGGDAEPVLRTLAYDSSGGVEEFISFELADTGSLVGYARLRVPGGEGADHAFVRELHVYGQMVPIDDAPGRNWQHRGYGEKLLEECERRATRAGRSELRITSGVGAREYYRSLGYARQGHYMAKSLRGG
ncbi:MAG: tRNA uridine(34) 5-carboxymethylaminomethyl modification radical SAM/GNAT enzyme Elp3 [Thermoplasmata archaeon]